MSFQENLRYYREKAGFKQAKDFVKVLGIPYNTYTSYENQGREPKYQTLIRIADLLDVSIDDLLGRGVVNNNMLKELIKNVVAQFEKYKLSAIKIAGNEILIIIEFKPYTIPIFVWKDKVLDEFRTLNSIRTEGNETKQLYKEKFIRDIVQSGVCLYMMRQIKEGLSETNIQNQSKLNDMLNMINNILSTKNERALFCINTNRDFE